MATSRLSEPITLPCGLVLPNRLVKSALAEQMANTRNLPATAQFDNAYGAWADGGWGMILSGNVQVDRRYLGDPHDTAIDASVPEAETLAAFKKFAATCRRNGTPAMLQINHPGRQSPLGAGNRKLFTKNIAPSAIPLELGTDGVSKCLGKLIFGTPQAMSSSDIEDVIERFCHAARVAVAAGFDGVQIHAAHGYLLAQFLSAKTNTRTDEFGGSPAARAKLVIDIIKAVREVVPETFCIGLKFNSVDHQPTDGDESSKELQDCLEQVSLIADAGLDFLEVSGGTYEQPLMMNGLENRPSQSSRSAAREAFFLDFAKEIRQKIPNVVLMVTGGFRSRLGMESAISSGACDLIGLGRPAVLNPGLPLNTILNPQLADEEALVHAEKIKTPRLLKKFAPRSVGAGIESKWYNRKIQAM